MYEGWSSKQTNTLDVANNVKCVSLSVCTFAGPNTDCCSSSKVNLENKVKSEVTVCACISERLLNNIRFKRWL